MTLDELLAIGQAYKEKHGGHVDVALFDIQTGGYVSLDEAVMKELFKTKWGFDDVSWENALCSAKPRPTIVLS